MAPRWLEDMHMHPDTIHDESNIRDAQDSDHLPNVTRELELAARLLLRTRGETTSATVHFVDEKLPFSERALEKSTTVDHDCLDEADDARSLTRRSTWLMPQELEKIRLGAKRKCIELQKVDYQNCEVCLAHRKITLMLKSDFKNIVRLTSTTPDEDLSQWCSFDDGRRGLERFASHAYNVLRNNDIYQTRNSVMQEQCSQREQGLYCPERIAHVAQKASRRARTFARFFGAADGNEAQKIASQEDFSTPQTGKKRQFSYPNPCEARQTVEQSPSKKKRSKLCHRVTSPMSITKT
jgi:hypothetical protein